MFEIAIEKSVYENIVLKDTKSGVTAVITPEKGGMLTSLKKDGKEYIFIDEESYNKPGRGHCAVPVLFPTVGRCKDENLTFNGVSYHMGIHGLVHSYKWDIIEQSTTDSASLTITVKSNEETKKSYPFDFEVRLTFKLKDTSITIDQEYINSGNDIMPFNFGFHPYFCISHLDNLTFDINAKNVYDALTDTTAEFTGEINHDLICGIGAIYTHTKDKTSIADSFDNRNITVKYDTNFKYVVIWTNQKNKFICIEPWSSVPNALNTGIDVNTLQPKQSLKAQYTIEI